ncbi:ABC transporter permease [Janibacter sp. YIM B02568]|uniref:ABC transporter permease n=1 Tax=Janibacter endophyticus TaxID=2806261 RepID=UPI001951F29C|nr:ABC transporter permease [Janibacter endophyticus]MBM6546452.1 ABC transporter permease [Janibacter endophyticus]
MTTATTTTAAPFAGRVLAQARFEAGILLRNGEQMLVSIILPLMTLVGLTLAPFPDLGEHERIDVVAPGVLGLVVMSTAFTGQAIQTGFDRRYGVLRYLGTTPLGRGGLLAAKGVAVAAVLVLQLAVLAAVAVAMGWRPQLAWLPVAILTLALGTWCFVALALALAGVLRAEAVLALANLVWVLLLAVGGVVIPATALHASADAVVRWLPSAALGDGLREPLLHGGLPLLPWLVLVVWAAAATVLAARTFRWSD